MAKPERLSRALASRPANLSFSSRELQFSFVLAPCVRSKEHALFYSFLFCFLDERSFHERITSIVFS